MQHRQWLGLELEWQPAGQEHRLNREVTLKMNGCLFGVKSYMNTRCTGYTTVDITVSPCQVPTVGRTVESERKAQRWERMCGYGESEGSSMPEAEGGRVWKERLGWAWKAGRAPSKDPRMPLRGAWLSLLTARVSNNIPTKCSACWNDMTYSS